MHRPNTIVVVWLFCFA